MKSVVIERIDSSDEGTFGVLMTQGVTLFTAELPWRENQNDFSCIPVGTYFCKWTWSNRFKRFMYLVDKVPDRTGIRFHSANFAGDKTLGFRCQLNGCISLGEKIGTMQGQKALIVSKPAVYKFEKLMGHEPFKLEIYFGGHP